MNWERLRLLKIEYEVAEIQKCTKIILKIVGEAGNRPYVSNLMKTTSLGPRNEGYVTVLAPCESVR